MTELISKVRIASSLPTPRALADYEPFDSICREQFGIAYKKHVGSSLLARIRADCRNAFGNEQSVGSCRFAAPAAVFFDMDATVIREESLVVLAQRVGQAEQVKSVTERAMGGEIDFSTALRQRVKLLAGMSVDEVAAVTDLLTLNPGIQAFTAFCRELSIPVFLVTGGFSIMAEVLRRKVGFDDFHANRFEVKSGVLTGELNGDIVDAAAKLSFVKAQCERLGLSLSDVAAVGDGANDLPMLQAVGCAVGYQPKDILKDSIDAIICGPSGHKFLGPLLFGRDLAKTRSMIGY